MKPRPRLCLGRTAAYLLPGKTRRICSIKPLRDEIRTVRSSHRPAYIIRKAPPSPTRFRLEMPSHWVSMQTRVRAGLDLCNRDGLTKFGTCCLQSKTKRTIQKNTRQTQCIQNQIATGFVCFMCLFFRKSFAVWNCRVPSVATELHEKHPQLFFRSCVFLARTFLPAKGLCRRAAWPRGVALTLN